MKISKNPSFKIVLTLSVVCCLFTACDTLIFGGKPVMHYKDISSIEDVLHLFPQTIHEIEAVVEKTKKEARASVETILSIPGKDRTFDNTVRGLDIISANFTTPRVALHVVQDTHPDEKVRDAAHAAMIDLSAFAVDLFNTLELAQVYVEYELAASKVEKLSDDERYLLSEEIKDLKRSGLYMEPKTYEVYKELIDRKKTLTRTVDIEEVDRAISALTNIEQIKALQKELSELSSAYSRNINEDTSAIYVSRAELLGLSDDFISGLEQNEEGLYRVGVDYPTFLEVMQKCSHQPTRKALYYAFQNRAYPENVELLERVIAKRDELARLLGFESFADLHLDSQMVKTVQKAEGFIRDLMDRGRPGAVREREKLSKDLPEGITLTEDGKFDPWDTSYVSTIYKKKHFDIDETEISEYFELEHTMSELFSIYESFLGITFTEVPSGPWKKQLWHKDVKLVEIHDKKSKELLGYILLDLYPRTGKYSHACDIPVVSGVSYLKADGTAYVRPAVSVVLANFPKPTKDKPSLLKLMQVRTFFHEFGHALHDMLGRTRFAGTSGTSVKTDFVELPSQMLEEWMWDKEILRKVSSHYKTGEPLPNELINAKIALKLFDCGSWVVGQGFYSLLSLNLFAPGAEKDSTSLMQALRAQTAIISRAVPDANFHASFNHLMGYGARYYGYLWSRVFALDLAEQIKKVGFLNGEIGGKYRREILEKGGSMDPERLLVNFLGREPKMDAFLKEYGLV